jgi:hypothetical protein
MMKADIYKLADELDGWSDLNDENVFAKHAAVMRKLADENEALHVLVGGQFNITVQTIPYTPVDSE